MRYQGDQAASIEVESRWQFFGRWSVVAFGGAGTTRTDRQAFVVTQNVASGGLGFRYELAASSACTPVSIGRTAQGPPQCISWWATRGSGLDM